MRANAVHAAEMGYRPVVEDGVFIQIVVVVVIVIVVIALWKYERTIYKLRVIREQMVHLHLFVFCVAASS